MKKIIALSFALLAVAPAAAQVVGGGGSSSFVLGGTPIPGAFAGCVIYVPTTTPACDSGLTYVSTVLNVGNAGSAAAPALTVGNSTTGFSSVSNTGFNISVNGVSKADYGITSGGVWFFNSAAFIGGTLQAAGNVNIANANIQLVAPLNGQLGVYNNLSAVQFDYGITTAATMTIVGNVAVTAMTQSSAVQSGTVCYTSSTGKLTYDATVGCLASTMDAKDHWQEIQPYEALNIVMQMRPGEFNYKPGLGLPEGAQVGLSAQQIEGIDSRLVGYDTDGKLRGVRYQQASALYPAAIRQLKMELDEYIRLHP